MKAPSHLAWKPLVVGVLACVLEEARLALRMVVWVFGFIGILCVVRAMCTAGKEEPLALTRSSRPEMAVIPGLPEYPGATCCEYREEVFGDERVTEIEYVVDSSVPQVRDHYLEAFARGDWALTDTAWVRGEWVYSVNRGDRQGVVEIEHRDGIIEVEVEMAEPALR